MKVLIENLPNLLLLFWVFLGMLVTLFSLLMAVCKAFGWQRATAVFASMAADVGKLAAVIQGYLPVNKPPKGD